MNILHYWNKWLTEDEESKLSVPSRRTFVFGGLAALATVALPDGWARMDSLLIPTDPILADINRITIEHLYPKVIADNFFRGSLFIVQLKKLHNILLDTSLNPVHQ